MKVIENTWNMLPALWKPRAYFTDTSPDLLRRRALYGGGLLLLILTLLVFASALFNMEGPRQIQQEFLRRLEIDPALLPRVAFPVSAILFGLNWIVLIVLSGIARYLFMRVLGEPRLSLLPVWQIGIHAVIPVMLVGTAVAIWNNLAPPGLPVPGDTGLGRMVLTTGLSLLAILWEAIVSASAFRVHFDQNVGRSILTALFPWALLIQLLMLF